MAEQAAAFRREARGNAPSTQQKQTRPGVVVQQAADASGPEGQLRHPGVEVAGVDIQLLSL